MKSRQNKFTDDNDNSNELIECNTFLTTSTPSYVPSGECVSYFITDSPKLDTDHVEIAIVAPSEEFINDFYGALKKRVMTAQLSPWGIMMVWTKTILLKSYLPIVVQDFI